MAAPSDEDASVAGRRDLVGPGLDDDGDDRHAVDRELPDGVTADVVGIDDRSVDVVVESLIADPAAHLTRVGDADEDDAAVGVAERDQGLLQRPAAGAGLELDPLVLAGGELGELLAAEELRDVDHRGGMDEL